MRITLLVLLCLISTVSVAADGGGPWDIGIDVSVLSDDNVTRAYAPGHIREDIATRIKLDVRYDLDFSINRALIFTGHLVDESYQDFDVFIAACDNRFSLPLAAFINCNQVF